MKIDKYKYINLISFKSLLNWSASSALGNKSNYKEELQTIAIGQLMDRNRHTVAISDKERYRRVTIKLYGRGVILRDEVSGTDIGTKRQFRISPGQFIMSKIDARNGAFGIVPDELKDAIVTQDFLSYNLNTKLVLPDYFLLFTSTQYFQDLCQRASSGTTGRQRIDETTFLNFSIPLPSLKRQKQLIRAYQSKIKLALKEQNAGEKLEEKMSLYIKNQLGLRTVTKQKRKGLQVVRFKDIKQWDTDYLLGKRLEIKSKFPLATYAELFISLRNGLSARDYSEKGVRFLKVTDIKNNAISNTDIKFINKFDENQLIDKNTLLLTRKGTVGQSFFVKEDKKYVVSSEVFIVKVDNSKVNGDFLAEINNVDFIQQQYKERYTGTIMPSMSQSKLQEIRIPMPPLRIQNVIARYVTLTKNKISIHINKANKLRESALKEFENALFKIK